MKFGFKLAELDAFRQIIFETGTGGSGTSLTVDEEALYFWHSTGGNRTIDLSLPLSQLNTEDDFLQAVLSLDSTSGKAAMYVRGAGGGSGAASADGDVGSPTGRSALFRWSNFGADVDGSLGGSAGDPPLDVESFFGSVALINVYDRPLSEEESLDAFSRIAIEVPDDDADGDGLPDFWEMAFFEGDIEDVAPDGNPDGDGFDNAAELANGTDPTKADTNGDGLNDDVEVNGEIPTDPKIADTDGDGRSDGDEVNGNPTSDPTRTDTDGDSYSDSFEVAQGSDPNNAASIPADTLGEPMLITDIIGALPSFNGFEGGLDALDATFRACVDFEKKSDPDLEVIFETGGGTIGFSLVYEEGSKLVLRAAGDGGLTVAVVEYSLTEQQINAGTLELTWTYDVDDGNGDSTIALFVDGAEAGSDTAFLGGDWSGGNGAGFGATGSGFAGTGENSDLFGVDFFSGTIDETKGLLFYPERLFSGAPVVTGDFNIVSIARSAEGNITLEWSSSPGIDYAIQGSTGDFTTWFEVEDTIQSEGDTTSYTDENLPPDTTDFYYRVIVQE